MLVKLGSGNELGSLLGTFGTHVFSAEDCLEQVRAAEAATTARKGKGKGKEREVPVGSPGLVEDIRTVPGAMEWDLHDTVTLGDEY